MFRQLSEADARDMLQQGELARLGCIVNGEPYIVPINYFLEGDRAYSHSLAGLKIDALRKNPRACLQLDEIEGDFQWRSVMAFGVYEEIDERATRERILTQLLRRFPKLTPVESAIAMDGEAPEIVVFCIKIKRVTAVAEE